MKEKLLRLASYALVAALSTLMTLTMLDHQIGLKPGKLDQLEHLIEEKFIGEADTQALLDAAANAMVTATGDRWSYYIPASEYESYREQQNNAYVGVGITIQLTDESQGFLITEVASGGSAEEAGLKVNDLLIGVEEQDVRGKSAADVRNLVRGEEGTFVTMRVLRRGEHMDFNVERRQVKTPVATYEMLKDNVGLITIENFDTRCAEETIAAIETLMENGARGLIFDVRNNPGGFASELVDLLDYLLPEGELFRVEYYDGRVDVDQSDESCLEVPMTVVVNASSYSAAEFFAAALSEYGVATVVGEQTVGKGYCQTTYQLSDGSAVALSIGKYVTPKGISLAGVGLKPDVPVSVDEETAASIYYGTLKPEEDPQIQAAMKLLR